MEWLWIWVGLAVLPGFVAHGKGRSFFGFFLLSLVLTPLLGLVIALCVAPDHVKLDRGTNSVARGEAIGRWVGQAIRGRH